MGLTEHRVLDFMCLNHYRADCFISFIIDRKKVHVFTLVNMYMCDDVRIQ